MKRQPQIDSEALMRDIARYLAAIEVFRAHGCEPTWRPELASKLVSSGSAQRNSPVELAH